MLLKTTFILCFLAIFSCTKDTECENTQLGILINSTGLDGCGWIIQLSDSTKLEPINLDDFNIELKEGKSIRFSYHELKNMASICMMGKIVEIDCIK